MGGTLKKKYEAQKPDEKTTIVCITAMKEYSGYDLQELRMKDYRSLKDFAEFNFKLALNIKEDVTRNYEKNIIKPESIATVTPNSVLNPNPLSGPAMNIEYDVRRVQTPTFESVNKVPFDELFSRVSNTNIEDVPIGNYEIFL